MFSLRMIIVGYICVALILSMASAANWSYAKLGDDWGGVCSSGQQQSPVNIWVNETQLSSDIKLKINGYKNYHSPGVPVLNKGYTVQANFPEDQENGGFQRTYYGNSTAKFQATQMQLYAPSQHTVQNQSYDAELHIVHSLEDGSLNSVIGIFFDRQKGGRDYNPIIGQMMITSGSSEQEKTINLNSWIQALDFTNFYAYDGSLTTPPCTENTQWQLLMDVQSLSDKQYLWLVEQQKNNEYFAGDNSNHRRPQPLNGRFIQASKKPAGWSPLIQYSGSAVHSAYAVTTLAVVTLVNMLVI